MEDRKTISFYLSQALFFILLCTSTTVNAAWFSGGYSSERKMISNDPAAIFITHAGLPWDWGRNAKNGVLNTIAFGLSKGLPIYFFVSPTEVLIPEDEQYWIHKSDHKKVNIVLSTGGQHQMAFPQANYFIMAGGFVDKCFCETLRDLIAYRQKATRFYLVTDAIFYNESLNLEKILAQLKPAEIKEYFQEILWPTKKDDFKKEPEFRSISRQQICLQGHYISSLHIREEKITFQRYQFIIVQNGFEIGRFGNGIPIELHLKHSSDFSKITR